jgi:MoxR-like ATPase
VLEEDEERRRTFRFQSGPVFANLVLADEINRATPKTQSALLEAMQEHTVTAAGQSMPVPEPFFVLATQNPIEMEGTYQLPEAQIDRFLFKTLVDYPSESELDAILELTTSAAAATPQQVLTAKEILELQALVRQVPIAGHVRQAVARLALVTQPALAASPADVKRYLRFGLSPRGAQALVLAAKGHALLAGRYNVAFEDLRAMLAPALRHRFQLNFEGEAEGVNAQTLLSGLFDAEVKRAA